MPDDHLLIQGEVRLLEGWQPHALHLWYATLKKPMNIALAEDSRFAFGVQVHDLLKPRMSPSSYSDLDALIELYPTSTIEFSTYDIGVGNIPGRNTVIWEVRDY